MNDTSSLAGVASLPRTRLTFEERPRFLTRLGSTGRLILVIVVILVLVFIIMYSFRHMSEHLLFGTVKEHTWKPPMAHTDVIEQGVHIWHFPTEGATKTVLFCHGSWGNISHREYLIRACLDQGLNVTVFDYRGYGRSEGSPDILGIQRDGVIAYQWLAARVPAKSIILWGESLGGGVATYIASRFPVDRLVLWCTFSSLRDVAVLGNYSIFMRMVARCSTAIMGDCPTSERLKKVTCPVMVAHSETDGLISMSNARRNYAAISHPHKHFLEIGGTHSSPVMTVQTLSRLMRFLEAGNNMCSALDPRCRESLARFHGHVAQLNKDRKAGKYQ